MTVRISPAVWVEVGRLSRAAFSAIQEALETEAVALGREPSLPESGELNVVDYVAGYEVDPLRRVMTLTAVRERR